MNNRIKVHLTGLAGEKKPESWGPMLVAANSERALSLLTDAGIPMEPPFAPKDVEGLCTLAGPFARSVVNNCLHEAMEESHRLVHKYMMYDVPGHEGVVFVWMGLTKHPAVDSGEHVALFGLFLQEMHKERAAHALECSHNPNECDWADLDANEVQEWMRYAGSQR